MISLVSALLLTLVAGSPPKPVHQQFDYATLDKEVQTLDLVALEHDVPKLIKGPEKDFYSGILANRQNRIQDSMRLLRASLPEVEQASPASAPAGYATLADDFLKIFDYADAAANYEALTTKYSKTIPAAQLDSLRDDLGVIKLITSYPPQTIAPYKPCIVASKRSQIDTINVQLEINGVSESWLLDTGANFSVITESMAKKLRLVPSKEVGQTKGGLNGIENPLHVALIPEIHFGNAVVKNVVVLVLRDQDLNLDLGTSKYQINAILGFPVLQALGSLQFKKNGDIAIAPNIRDPKNAAKMYLMKLIPLIEATFLQQDLIFSFDTGANASNFTKKFYDRFNKQLPNLKKAKDTSGGAGGSATHDVFLLPSGDLTIGGKDVALKNMVVMPFLVNTEIDDTNGNLGRDITEGSDSFTIDFKHMRFFFGR